MSKAWGRRTDPRGRGRRADPGPGAGAGRPERRGERLRPPGCSWTCGPPRQPVFRGGFQASRVCRAEPRAAGCAHAIPGRGRGRPSTGLWGQLGGLHSDPAWRGSARAAGVTQSALGSPVFLGADHRSCCSGGVGYPEPESEPEPELEWLGRQGMLFSLDFAPWAMAPPSTQMPKSEAWASFSPELPQIHRTHSEL